MAPSPKKDTGLCGIYWESPPKPRGKDVYYDESTKSDTSRESSLSSEAESATEVHRVRLGSEQSDTAMGPIKDNCKSHST